MKIGFDAKRAAQNRTGLGNYSRFVIDIMSRYAAQNQYQLYVPNPAKASLLGRVHTNTEIITPHRKTDTLFRSFWRSWGMTADIRQNQTDLFHGLSNELPLNIRQAAHTKSIVTIHDLIFLRYPEYYHAIDRKIYQFKFRKACELADRIIAVSECTKRDIVDFYRIAPEKIDVVYQGCDPQFRQKVSETEKEQVRHTYGLPEHYILYLGSIESRKNLMLIIQALLHTQTDLPVVAVGKHTPYADQVMTFARQNGLEKRLHMLHGVPFQALPALYQMASVFVYPSFFEGFGIPLLEALNSRIPVIGAQGSCLEEAGGPHSIYVDPCNPNELADAIDRVLSQEDLRQTMIEEGYQYARRFDEEKLAADLWQVYQKTLNS